MLNVQTYDNVYEQHWARIKSIQRHYAAQLRATAKQIGKLVTELFKANAENVIEQALEEFATVIEPWAASTANKMIAEVALKDQSAWMKNAGRMARAMQAELATMPYSNLITELRNKQVQLIKSLPLEAAQQAQNLAFEAATLTGERYNVVAEKILKLGEITEARAMLIARTEVTTSHAIIREARAKWIGSEQYIWRTMKDKLVRHKQLEGQVFSWDDPPIAEKNGEKHHPGCFPNCRCFAEPILPAKYLIVRNRNVH